MVLYYYYYVIGAEMSGHNDRVWYTRWTSRYRKRVYIYMYIRSFIILIRSYRVLRGPRLLVGPAGGPLFLSHSLFLFHHTTHACTHFIFLSFSLTLYLVFFQQSSPFTISGVVGGCDVVAWTSRGRGEDERHIILLWKEKKIIILSSKSPETYLL